MIRFLFLIPLTILSQNEYYSSCYGLSGNELNQELSNIIDNHIYYSYSQVKDILRLSDEDPQNQDNIILVYTGNSINKESFASNNEQDFWNREHVWPKSHGSFGPSDEYSIPAFTDVHNLKPSDASINSYRSDKDFENGGDIVFNGNIITNCFGTSQTFEPREDVKGDIARIIFYMDIRYNGGENELSLDIVDYLTSYPDPEIGVLSTLIDWHENDPPDDFESRRNDIIFSYQQNRNPFIDFPQLVDLIYVNQGDVFLNSGCMDDTSCNYNPFALTNSNCLYLNDENFCSEQQLFQQSIELNEGWSIFSTYLDVEESSLDYLFNDIINKIVIIKDDQGNVYWPEYYLNSINFLEIGKAYQIKMYENESITFSGIKVDHNTPISLSDGWNLLGYLHENPSEIEYMLSPIVDNLVIIKDNVGNVFWPEFNLNSMQQIQPNKGYQIKLQYSSIFSFPDLE